MPPSSSGWRVVPSSPGQGVPGWRYALSAKCCIPISWMGVPLPSAGWGTPRQLDGVHPLAGWEYPHWLDGGTPTPTGWMGYPPAPEVSTDLPHSFGMRAVTNMDAIFRCGSRTEEPNGEKLKNSKEDQSRNNKDKVRF